MTDDEQAFYLLKLAAKAARRKGGETMRWGYDPETKTGFIQSA